MWIWQGKGGLLNKPYLVKWSTKGGQKYPKICPHGFRTTLNEVGGRSKRIFEPHMA